MAKTVDLDISHDPAERAARNFLVGKEERYEMALKQFADPKNWHCEAGCLQWIGKRNAVEYAQSVLVGP